MSMSTIFVTSGYPSFCGQMCREENGQFRRHSLHKYIKTNLVNVYKPFLIDSDQLHMILKFSIMTSSAGRDVITGR